ncbi:MAG: HypC/HybG/HupF family hydrogenase formation chaperone [Elusimicrobiota bacterium]
MCLAVPGKVIKINKTVAIIDYDGVKKDAMTDLTPDVKVGDYVIVHAGFSIQILNEDDAKETLKLLREVDEAAKR